MICEYQIIKRALVRQKIEFQETHFPDRTRIQIKSEESNPGTMYFFDYKYTSLVFSANGNLFMVSGY